MGDIPFYDAEPPARIVKRSRYGEIYEKGLGTMEAGGPWRAFEVPCNQFRCFNSSVRTYANKHYGNGAFTFRSDTSKIEERGVIILWVKRNESNRPDQKVHLEPAYSLS